MVALESVRYDVGSIHGPHRGKLSGYVVDALRFPVIGALLDPSMASFARCFGFGFDEVGKSGSSLLPRRELCR